jgi:hypothetical protein
VGKVILFWLLVAHALCDFPLQGSFLAAGKNPYNPIPGVPWQVCLFAHALIHAGAVTLVTGSILLGAIEMYSHALLDWGKCGAVHYIGPHKPSGISVVFWIDQGAHVTLKLLYYGMLSWALIP